MPKQPGWSPEQQVRSERPDDPIRDACDLHRGRRTVVVLRDARTHCLACHGCPRCAARPVQIIESLDDSRLFNDPVTMGGRLIRGDWRCFACGEQLVDWGTWRRLMRSWVKGQAAARENRRRPR